MCSTTSRVNIRDVAEQQKWLPTPPLGCRQVMEHRSYSETCSHDQQSPSRETRGIERHQQTHEEQPNRREQPNPTETHRTYLGHQGDEARRAGEWKVGGYGVLLSLIGPRTTGRGVKYERCHDAVKSGLGGFKSAAQLAADFVSIGGNWRDAAQLVCGITVPVSGLWTSAFCAV